MGCKQSYRGGPSLTAEQIADVAIACGMTDPVRAVATALAETRGHYRAWCLNDDDTKDRGLFQLNSRWFANVTDEQAYDPGCASWIVARYTRGGDWQPWSRSATGPQLARASAAVESVRTKLAAGVEGARPPTLDAGGNPRPGTYSLGKAGGRAITINAQTNVEGDLNPLDPREGIEVAADAVNTVLGPIKTVTDAVAAIGRLFAAVLGRLFSPAFWRRVGLGLAAVALVAGAVVLIVRETADNTISAITNPAK